MTQAFGRRISDKRTSPVASTFPSKLASFPTGGGGGGGDSGMIAPPRREQRVQGGAPPPPGSGMTSAPRSGEVKSPSPSLPPSGRSPGRSPGRRGSGQKPGAQHHRGITRGAGDTSSNTTDEDWATLAAKLPVGRSDEDKKKRRKLFNDFDPNGNGYLSLAEVDLGVRKALNSDALFNAKPAIMRAFQAAKDSVNTGSKLGPDFVVRQTSWFSNESKHERRGSCSSLFILVCTAVSYSSN